MPDIPQHRILLDTGRTLGDPLKERAAGLNAEGKVAITLVTTRTHEEALAVIAREGQNLTAVFTSYNTTMSTEAPAIEVAKAAVAAGIKIVVLQGYADIDTGQIPNSINTRWAGTTALTPYILEDLMGKVR